MTKCTTKSIAKIKTKNEKFQRPGIRSLLVPKTFSSCLLFSSLLSLYCSLYKIRTKKKKLQNEVNEPMLLLYDTEEKQRERKGKIFPKESFKDRKWKILTAWFSFVYVISGTHYFRGKNRGATWPLPDTEMYVFNSYISYFLWINGF